MNCISSFEYSQFSDTRLAAFVYTSNSIIFRDKNAIFTPIKGENNSQLFYIDVIN